MEDKNDSLGCFAVGNLLFAIGFAIYAYCQHWFDSIVCFLIVVLDAVFVLVIATRNHDEEE